MSGGHDNGFKQKNKSKLNLTWNPANHINKECIRIETKNKLFKKSSLKRENKEKIYIFEGNIYIGLWTFNAYDTKFSKNGSSIISKGLRMNLKSYHFCYCYDFMGVHAEYCEYRSVVFVNQERVVKKKLRTNAIQWILKIPSG